MFAHQSQTKSLANQKSLKELEQIFFKSNYYYSNITIGGHARGKDIEEGTFSFDFAVMKHHQISDYSDVVDNACSLINLYESRYHQQNDMLAGIKLANIYTFGMRFYIDEKFQKNIINVDLLKPAKGLSKCCQLGQDTEKAKAILQNLGSLNLFPKACQRLNRFNGQTEVPEAERVTGIRNL